jgi:hypothetical protein
MFGFHHDCLDFTGGKTVRFFWISTREAPQTAERRLERSLVPPGTAGPRRQQHAGVVELADTGDLKSPDPQGLYGFDPRLRQSIRSCTEVVMAGKIGEYLIEKGVMSSTQVATVINRQKAGDERRFGEIAMELGYLADNEPIDKFLELQDNKPPK